MVVKQITGRQLPREAHENSLAPGEYLIVKKRNGKTFRLKRIDGVPKDMNAALAKLFAEIPPKGRRVKTDLARLIIEDRE